MDLKKQRNLALLKYNGQLVKEREKLITTYIEWFARKKKKREKVELLKYNGPLVKKNIEKLALHKQNGPRVKREENATT